MMRIVAGKSNKKIGVTAGKKKKKKSSKEFEIEITAGKSSKRRKKTLPE